MTLHFATFECGARCARRCDAPRASSGTAAHRSRCVASCARLAFVFVAAAAEPARAAVNTAPSRSQRRSPRAEAAGKATEAVKRKTCNATEKRLHEIIGGCQPAARARIDEQVRFRSSASPPRRVRGVGQVEAQRQRELEREWLCIAGWEASLQSERERPASSTLQSAAGSS